MATEKPLSLDEQVEQLRRSRDDYEKRKILNQEEKRRLQTVNAENLAKEYLKKNCPAGTKIPTLKEIDEDWEKQKIKKAQEKKEADRSKRIENYFSIIPEKYKHSEFTDYAAESEEETKNYAIMKRFAENFHVAREKGSGILLFGNPGTGKTLLSFAVFKHVVRNNYSANYTKAKRMISDIRSSYSSGEPEWEIKQKYISPDLLIIDEVGRQDSKDSAREEIFEVLDYRAEENRPTICISNLGIDGVKFYLGDAGFSRALNGGLSLVFTGRDRRITKS